MKQGTAWLPHLALVALVFVATAAAAEPATKIPFSEAEIYLELNDTDGDLGIHSSIDGEPWRHLEIEDPRGRLILQVLNKGPLRNQGLTQLFFESAEPTLDEFPPDKFFRRFPEGEYEIEAETLDGETLESTDELTHVLAAPPNNVLVSGVPAAENCDVDPLPLVTAPVVIRWDPVMASHPTLGRPGPIEVIRYQLFVERGDVKFSVDLPPTVTEFEVPAEITDTGDRFKFEIIVREASGNNTAIESCYRVQ